MYVRATSIASVKGVNRAILDRHAKLALRGLENTTPSLFSVSKKYLL